MANATHPLSASLVRLRAGEGTVVGAGFLAAPGLICTCAHVVARALGLPDTEESPVGAEVGLDFPFLDGATARVVVARWLPILTTGGGDLAVLRLIDPPPTGSRPAPLLVEGALPNRQFEVYGVPVGADEGRWADGVTSHRLANGLVQLKDGTGSGYRVQPGFSGAPVWDPVAKGVIGMVVAADEDITTRTSYMAPAPALAQLEPALDRSSAEGIDALPYLSAASSPLGERTTDLPSGTVAFLFTDIEGSTKLWERLPGPMAAAVARHDALLRAAIAAHGGVVFKTVGDAFCAAFSTAPQALAAALAGQRSLASADWTETGPLKARMAIHVSHAEERDADYFGRPINRLARLLSTGYGGQILLSAAARELVLHFLPNGVRLDNQGRHRLKDLMDEEQIYQVQAPDLPSAFPPLKSLDRARHNLPEQLTPFVGREQQTREIATMLRTGHQWLVTLTGPGGIGKTRLCLQVAADLSDEFSDGVWFVPLADIERRAKDNPAALVETVASAIAAAVGARTHGGEPIVKHLIDHLRDKHLLLVLDNVEHLLESAPLVADLRRKCPRLKLLTTSRERLGITGEQIYHVQMMHLPVSDPLPPVDEIATFEGIRLFLERAKEKQHDFALTEANAPVVVAICRELDGLPLAIEIAAARIGYFPSLGDLRERLGEGLEELARDAPDQPDRLRTMRASIAWSYRLLERPERALFRRLAVFAGGFTREAAIAIGAATAREAAGSSKRLDALIDQSLIRPEASATGSRYRMLETIREYGLEQLEERKEDQTTRQRHAAYFLALAERAKPEFMGPDQTLWLDRLEAERDNIAAALDWALREPAEADLALRLASALWPFWQIRGYLREALDGLERAVAKGESAAPEIRAAAIYGLGRIAFDLGDYGMAPQLFEQSLELRRQIGDRRGVAESLTDLGFAVAAHGDRTRARALHEEALTIWRELGDTRGIAGSLYRLGNLALDDRDLDGARALYRESLANRREPEDTIPIANLHWTLAATARLEGNGPAAAESIERSLALFRRVGNKIGIGNALVEWGHAMRLLGDDRRAERSYVEALTVFQELGTQSGMVEGLEGLAGVAAAHGRTAYAATLLGATTAWRERLKQPFFPAVDRNTLERLVSEVRPVAEHAFAAGRDLPLDLAVAHGLTALTFPDGALSVEGFETVHGAPSSTLPIEGTK